jgi:hypothetical protein
MDKRTDIFLRDVRPQIDNLALRRGTPLIVTDADEVLFRFFAAFEAFIEVRGLYFNYESFRLTGNVLARHDDRAVEADEVGALLGQFFETETERIPPVEEAAPSLAHLSGLAQIVVLSNVPPARKAARERALATHGMPYPLVANSGRKGLAVRHLAEIVDAPVVFIDDIPLNHESVSEHAHHVHRLQFVADERLASLVTPSPHADHWMADWGTMTRHIETHLNHRV